MIDEMIIKLAPLLCFPGKGHEDVVKLEVCTIEVLGAKYGIFLLAMAGHMTTHRGPDVARGPDVVHHWHRRYRQQAIFASNLEYLNNNIFP